MVAFARPDNWDDLSIAPADRLYTLRPDLECFMFDGWKQGRPCSISTYRDEASRCNFVVVAWNDAGISDDGPDERIEVPVEERREDEYYIESETRAALKAVELYHARVDPYR